MAGTGSQSGLLRRLRRMLAWYPFIWSWRWRQLLSCLFIGWLILSLFGALGGNLSLLLLRSLLRLSPRRER
jgi:hypothetical protein